MAHDRVARYLALAAAAVLSGCSNDDPVAPAPVTPVDPGEVNDYVKSLPDWEVPDDTELEPVVQAAEEEFNGSAYLRCETVEYDRKQNFDNLVAVGANATALKPGMLVQGRGVRNGALSVIGLKRSPIAIFVDLALALRRARVRVVVANLDKEIRQSRLAALLAGRRLRLVARRGSPDPIKSAWDYRLAYTHGVDRLICNAEALVESVCGPAPWFDRSRVRVIPNGVDVAALGQAARVADLRAELAIPPDALVVGCVGEVGWRKAQEHVLTAAAQLRERFPGAVWLVAGEG